MFQLVDQSTHCDKFVYIHNLDYLLIQETFFLALKGHLFGEDSPLYRSIAEHIDAREYLHQLLVYSTVIDPFAHNRQTFQTSAYPPSFIQILLSILEVSRLSIQQQKTRELLKTQHRWDLSFILRNFISQEVRVDTVEHHNHRFVEQIIKQLLFRDKSLRGVL